MQAVGSNNLMPDYPEAKAFFMGVLAGSIQKVVTYPLEVRSVMRNVLNEPPQKMSDLARGLMFSLSISAIKNGCCFVMNWEVKQLFPYDSKLSSFVGGAASGALEIAWNPSVVIKQDIQTGKAKNIFEAIKNRQTNSYWNGWKAMLCRNVIHSSTMYGSYSLIVENENSYPLKMLKGGVCSVAGTFFSWPWEFVRGQQAKEVTNVYSTALTIFRKNMDREGIKRIYKGFFSAASKQFIQGAILGPFISYILCNEE